MIFADWKRIVELRAKTPEERDMLLAPVYLRQATLAIERGQPLEMSLRLASLSFRAGVKLRHGLYLATLVSALLGGRDDQLRRITSRFKRKPQAL
jgi:hypothetical protein